MDYLKEFSSEILADSEELAHYEGLIDCPMRQAIEKNVKMMIDDEVLKQVLGILCLFSLRVSTC